MKLTPLFSLVCLSFTTAAIHAQYVPMAFNPGSGSSPVPAYVQSVTGGTAGETNSITITGVTAPHALYVSLYDGGGINLTLTAGGDGNSWSTIKSANLAADGDTVALACAIASSSGSDTIKFYQSGVQTPMFGTVYEVSNSTCTPDVTPVSSNTTATACSSGALTTATANDFLVGLCGLSTPQTPFAAGSGWSHGLNAGSSGSNLDLMSEVQLAASPGSYTATSGTLSSTEQAAIEVAFQPTGTGGSCSTLADQQTGTNNESSPLGNGSGNTYGAFAFTAASTYTLCSIAVPLEKVASPSYTLNAYIYSASGTTPGALIGTGSAGLATSSLSGSYATATFTGLNASIVTGTQYWVVIVSSGAPNDFTNYVNWGGTGTTCTPYFAVSAAGTSWTNAGPCTAGIISTYHH